MNERINDCAAVIPDGTLETERDTINRLRQNRDELVVAIKSLQAERDRYREALKGADMALENAQMYAIEYHKRDMYRNLKAARDNIKSTLSDNNA